MIMNYILSLEEYIYETEVAAQAPATPEAPKKENKVLAHIKRNKGKYLAGAVAGTALYGANKLRHGLIAGLAGNAAANTSLSDDERENAKKIALEHAKKMTIAGSIRRGKAKQNEKDMADGINKLHKEKSGDRHFISQVKGTGPNGQITSDDIQKYLRKNK